MPVKNEYYKTIQGWFNFQKPYERIVNIAPPGATLVEVGSWRGCSTVYLATYIKEQGRNDLLVYAVDTWNGTPDEDVHAQIKRKIGGADPIWTEFRNNLVNAGVDTLIEPIRNPSVEAAKEFKPESLYFVYIDAGHTYEDVMKDIIAWWPLVQKGGVLAGHDYHRDSSQVVAAVHDYFGEEIKVFQEARTWWVDKL